MGIERSEVTLGIFHPRESNLCFYIVHDHWLVHDGPRERLGAVSLKWVRLSLSRDTLVTLQILIGFV